MTSCTGRTVSITSQGAASIMDARPFFGTLHVLRQIEPFCYRCGSGDLACDMPSNEDRFVCMDCGNVFSFQWAVPR